MREPRFIGYLVDTKSSPYLVRNFLPCPFFSQILSYISWVIPLIVHPRRSRSCSTDSRAVSWTRRSSWDPLTTNAWSTWWTTRSTHAPEARSRSSFASPWRDVRGELLISIALNQFSTSQSSFPFSFFSEAYRSTTIYFWSEFSSWRHFSHPQLWKQNISDIMFCLFFDFERFKVLIVKEYECWTEIRSDFLRPIIDSPGIFHLLNWSHFHTDFFTSFHGF